MPARSSVRVRVIACRRSADGDTLALPCEPTNSARPRWEPGRQKSPYPYIEEPDSGGVNNGQKAMSQVLQRSPGGGSTSADGASICSRRARRGLQSRLGSVPASGEKPSGDPGRPVLIADAASVS